MIINLFALAYSTIRHPNCIRTRTSIAILKEIFQNIIVIIGHGDNGRMI